MTEQLIKPKDCPDGICSLRFPSPEPDAAAPRAAAEREKWGGVEALHGRVAVRF